MWSCCWHRWCRSPACSTTEWVHPAAEQHFCSDQPHAATPHYSNRQHRVRAALVRNTALRGTLGRSLPVAHQRDVIDDRLHSCWVTVSHSSDTADTTTTLVTISLARWSSRLVLVMYSSVASVLYYVLPLLHAYEHVWCVCEHCTAEVERVFSACVLVDIGAVALYTCYSYHHLYINYNNNQWCLYVILIIIHCKPAQNHFA